MRRKLASNRCLLALGHRKAPGNDESLNKKPIVQGEKHPVSLFVAAKHCQALSHDEIDSSMHGVDIVAGQRVCFVLLHRAH